MILKHKDHIQSAIDCLGSLAKQTDGDARTANNLRRELASLRGGEKGERECAFHLDGVVKDHPYRVLIHDLRIEHNGEVAQFDHLLINSKMEIWILESKSYLNGFRISDHGEFEYWYANHYHGMASPIEQVKRQARILEKVFAAHDLAPKRLGFTLHPIIKTAILVDPKMRVIRPDPKSFNTDMVIKADAFFTRYEEMNERTSVLAVIGSLAKLVKKDAIIELGQRLVALHRPHQVDYRAKFGIPGVCAEAVTAPNAAQSNAQTTAPPTPVLAASAAPTCPLCRATMVLRSAKRGANAGTNFWGCSRYPTCRGMAAAEPTASSTVASEPPHAAPVAKKPSPSITTPEPAQASRSNAPVDCPRCGKAMVLRIAKQGGNQFWGCPAFPKCRAMAPLAPEDSDPAAV